MATITAFSGMDSRRDFESGGAIVEPTVSAVFQHKFVLHRLQDSSSIDRKIIAQNRTVSCLEVVFSNAVNSKYNSGLFREI